MASSLSPISAGSMEECDFTSMSRPRSKRKPCGDSCTVSVRSVRKLLTGLCFSTSMIKYSSRGSGLRSTLLLAMALMPQRGLCFNMYTKGNASPFSRTSAKRSLSVSSSHTAGSNIRMIQLSIWSPWGTTTWLYAAHACFWERQEENAVAKTIATPSMRKNFFISRVYRKHRIRQR